MGNIKKFCAFIPARKGSKRITDKNILKLRGKPLIYWAYLQARNANIFDDLFLSTDSERYEDVARGFGLKVVRRYFPTDDLSPDAEWIQQAFSKMKGYYPEYDYFAIVRPTNPFRKSATIREACLKFLEIADRYDSLKAYIDPPVTPYKIFEIKMVDGDRVMVPILDDIADAYTLPSNAFLKRTFAAQVGFLDICKRENLEKYGNYFGQKIFPFKIHNPIEAIDINTLADLDIVTALIESGRVEMEV